MLLQQFKCQRCDHRFDAEIFDRDEPRERDIPGPPLRCPECQSTFLEVLRTIERRKRRAS